MLVVFERDALPLDALLLVLFLLKCKHVLIELLLKLLICVVDTQLLERVLREDLETKDIKQANKRKLV